MHLRHTSLKGRGGRDAKENRAQEHLGERCGAYELTGCWAAVDERRPWFPGFGGCGQGITT